MSLSATRGVFSLRQIYNSQRKGTGYPLSDVFVQPPPSPTANNGYIGGGDSRSAVDKLNFSDETSSRAPTADLPNNQTRGAAVGGLSAGYFAGGNPGSGSSTIQKLAYSTDTSSVISPQMTAARYACDGTARSTDGYIVGGGISPGTTGVRSIVERFTFSNETVERIPGMDLQSPRQGMAVGGNQTHGYAIGGFTTGINPVTDASKLTYANDTSAAAPTANIPGTARSGLAQSGNSTHGYFSGSNHSPVFKTVYSTDTTTTLPSPNALSAAMNYGAATGNTTNSYIGAGFNARVNINRIAQSTDTTTRIPGMDMSYTTTGGNMGLSAREYGNPSIGGPNPVQQFTTGTTVQPTYAAGGMFGTTGPWSAVSSNDKINLVTETQSVGTDFIYAQGSGAAVTDGVTAGYIGGGRASNANISNVGKLTYSTDTSERIPNNTTTQRRWCDGLSSPSAGYFLGGNTLSSTDKLTYSSEAVARIPALDLNPGGSHNSATFGLSDRGYRIFGQSPSSAGQKITYADDTLVRVPALDGPTSPARSACSGHQSPTDGYALGGARATYVTTVNRINFATETNVAAKPLAAAAGYVGGGGGTQTNAYLYGGGSLPNPSTHTFIHRYEMATETASLLANTFLQSTRYCVGNLTSGHGNGINAGPVATPTAQTFPVPQPDAAPPITGYVCSGESSASVSNNSSSVKLNMSTDAYSAVPSMNLTTTNNGSPENYRNYAAGTSSPTHGYLIGGYAPNHSNATKCEYVTETFQAIPGNTSEARRSVAQTGGSSARGYLMGGYSEAQSPNRNVSNTDKLVYSTETMGRQPSANLSSQRGNAGAVSNQTNIYTICGQDGPASQSTVDRINMPSDSTDRIPGANDPQARQWCRTTYYPSPERGYSSGGRDSASNTWYSLTTRFNFSDETSSSVPGGNLTSNRKDHMAVGNTTTGYQSGGNFPGGGGPNVAQSTTEKLNMSTETYAAAPSANLDVARWVGSGFGPYMNNNPSANVPQAPVPTPNNC